MQIKVEKNDNGRLLINAEFAGVLAFNGITSFEELRKIPGEPVKNILKERGTERVFLKSPDGSGLTEAYIKRYRPEPLKSRLKNILSLRPSRFPGALNEWEAIIEFHNRSLPSMLPVACGMDGQSGDSCILTLGIRDYARASELFAKFTEEHKSRKRKLIRKIAGLAAGMHSAGLAHQDFYLVHIFVREKEDDNISLIDLQRVVFRESFSERWRVKDLAQLLYSSEKFVTRSDILYFWKTYTDIAGTELYRNKTLVKRIYGKAAGIRKHAG